MLGLRVVACPVSQATNGKASHSHRAPQGVIAQQIRVGQVRVQLLDQVEVGSMLMDERTESVWWCTGGSDSEIVNGADVAEPPASVMLAVTVSVPVINLPG